MGCCKALVKYHAIYGIAIERKMVKHAHIDLSISTLIRLHWCNRIDGRKRWFENTVWNASISTQFVDTHSHRTLTYMYLAYICR